MCVCVCVCVCAEIERVREREVSGRYIFCVFLFHRLHIIFFFAKRSDIFVSTS